jgi:lysophospholipid hydrolase
VRSIDFALDCRMLEAGQALYRQNEPAECLYVVLSGRLRSVIAGAGDKKEAIEEFGRSDLVGLVELLSKKPRATTVLTVRYSQMATVPSGLLAYIIMKYPDVNHRMMSMLANYYTSYHRKITSGGCPTQNTHNHLQQDSQASP